MGKAKVIEMNGGQRAMEEEDEPPVKKARERIELIEQFPQDDWFVTKKDHRGRLVWYLRFCMTGQHPRRYGPFKSRHVALLFLDRALNDMGDQLLEVNDTARKYAIKGPYDQRWGCIIEDEIASQYLSQKGR